MGLCAKCGHKNDLRSVKYRCQKCAARIIHTRQGSGGSVEEYYLEDPTSPSRAAATASLTGDAATTAVGTPRATTASPGGSKASPGIVLKEKLRIAEREKCFTGA